MIFNVAPVATCRFTLESLHVVLVIIVAAGHTTALQGDEFCQGRPNQLYAHPESCGWFIECHYENLFVKKCVSGLHFNEKIQACDFPFSAACQERNSSSRGRREGPVLVPKSKKEADQDRNQGGSETHSSESAINQLAHAINQVQLKSSKDKGQDYDNSNYKIYPSTFRRRLYSPTRYTTFARPYIRRPVRYRSHPQRIVSKPEPKMKEWRDDLSNAYQGTVKSDIYASVSRLRDSELKPRLTPQRTADVNITQRSLPDDDQQVLPDTKEELRITYEQVKNQDLRQEPIDSSTYIKSPAKQYQNRPQPIQYPRRAMYRSKNLLPKRNEETRRPYFHRVQPFRKVQRQRYSFPHEIRPTRYESGARYDQIYATRKAYPQIQGTRSRPWIQERLKTDETQGRTIHGSPSRQYQERVDRQNSVYRPSPSIAYVSQKSSSALRSVPVNSRYSTLKRGFPDTQYEYYDFPEETPISMAKSSGDYYALNELEYPQDIGPSSRRGTILERTPARQVRLEINRLFPPSVRRVPETPKAKFRVPPFQRMRRPPPPPKPPNESLYKHLNKDIYASTRTRNRGHIHLVSQYRPKSHLINQLRSSMPYVTAYQDSEPLISRKQPTEMLKPMVADTSLNSAGKAGTRSEVLKSDARVRDTERSPQISSAPQTNKSSPPLIKRDQAGSQNDHSMSLRRGPMFNFNKTTTDTVKTNKTEENHAGQTKEAYTSKWRSTFNARYQRTLPRVRTKNKTGFSWLNEADHMKSDFRASGSHLPHWPQGEQRVPYGGTNWQNPHHTHELQGNLHSLVMQGGREHKTIAHRHVEHSSRHEEPVQYANHASNSWERPWTILQTADRQDGQLRETTERARKRRSPDRQDDVNYYSYVQPGQSRLAKPIFAVHHKHINSVFNGSTFSRTNATPLRYFPPLIAPKMSLIKSDFLKNKRKKKLQFNQTKKPHSDLGQPKNLHGDLMKLIKGFHLNKTQEDKNYKCAEQNKMKPHGYGTNDGILDTLTLNVSAGWSEGAEGKSSSYRETAPQNDVGNSPADSKITIRIDQAVSGPNSHDISITASARGSAILHVTSIWFRNKSKDLLYGDGAKIKRSKLFSYGNSKRTRQAKGALKVLNFPTGIDNDNETPVIFRERGLRRSEADTNSELPSLDTRQKQLQVKGAKRMVHRTPSVAPEWSAYIAKSREMPFDGDLPLSHTHQKSTNYYSKSAWLRRFGLDFVPEGRVLQGEGKGNEYGDSLEQSAGQEDMPRTRLFGELGDTMHLILRHMNYQQGKILRMYTPMVMRRARAIIQERLRHEAAMTVWMKGVVDSAPYRYVAANMNAKPYAKYLSHSGVVMLEYMKIFKEKYKIQPFDVVRLAQNISREGYRFLKEMPVKTRADNKMPVPPGTDYCPYPHNYECNGNYPYRSADGSCNNLNQPLWGRSMIPHRRILPQNYGDGIESSRISITGSSLPSARLVSLHMLPDTNKPNSLNPLLLMTWGQFVDHELTRTAISEISRDESGFGETEEVMCGYDGCLSYHPGLEACWPIAVPKADPDFGYFNNCLKFVRSQAVPHLNCLPSPREQMNQVTPWIDGSMIYGSTKEESDVLRDLANPNRGRMLVTPHPKGPYYKPLLPQDDNDLCRGANSTIKCFKAGDGRVNEQVSLTVMHTLWVREHNRIEAALHYYNPHWDGDRLYQETRRIVGAKIQHIIFNEHLPLLLGPRILEHYGLKLQPRGYYYGYDPRVDPRIANSFSSAAYRFGHTLIQERFRRADADYNYDDTLMLSQAFRRPVHLYDTKHGGIDALVRGLCEFKAQSFDRFITKQISKSLFTEDPPRGPSMDLMSLNIQRARDHGLRGYNSFRHVCGLKRARTFDDLAGEIPCRRSRDMLRHLYRHVDDIDLFVGGISEESVSGGVLGPTFACIIAQQFQVLRKGDRFWYENDNNAGFTPDQLQEIRKTRLSRVLCVNGDRIEYIQPWALLNVFRKVGNEGRQYDEPLKNGVWLRDSPFLRSFFGTKQYGSKGEAVNSRVHCNSLPDLDLSRWREKYYGK